MGAVDAPIIESKDEGPRLELSGQTNAYICKQVVVYFPYYE
jgi:hypothetical protein